VLHVGGHRVDGLRRLVDRGPHAHDDDLVLDAPVGDLERGEGREEDLLLEGVG